MKSLIALMLAGLVLTGCGTRLNPLNWFGNSREVAVTTEPAEVNPLLPRRARSAFARPEVVYAGVPVDTIEDLRIERTLSGAIINAVGVAARQGAFDARLTPANPEEVVDGNGVLTYRLDVIYPRAATPVGTQASRRVVVARTVSQEVLDTVRVVRVVGAANARESRRR